MFMNMANGFGGDISEYNDDTFVHQEEDSSDEEGSGNNNELPKLLDD